MNTARRRRRDESPRLSLGAFTPAVMLAALLAACGSSPPKVATSKPVPAPAQAHLSAKAHPAAQPAVRAPADPNDWHVLITVPFGTLLKDIPFTLHEVLLFRDEAQHSALPQNPECYTSVTAPAPDFMGRAPDEYLLCFKHDRLSRIEASVYLPAAGAAQSFTAACAAWLKNAAARAAAAPASEPAPASQSAPASAAASAPAAPSPQSASVCEGSDGDVHFSAQLVEESDQTEPALSVTLDSIADRQ